MVIRKEVTSGTAAVAAVMLALSAAVDNSPRDMATAALLALFAVVIYRSE